MNSNDDLDNLLNSDSENSIDDDINDNLDINDTNIDIPKIDDNNLKKMIKDIQKMSDSERNSFLENIMKNFNINNDENYDSVDPHTAQRLKLRNKLNNSKMKRQGKANLKKKIASMKNNNKLNKTNTVINKKFTSNINKEAIKKKLRNKKNKERKKRKREKRKLINNNIYSDKEYHNTVKNKKLESIIDKIKNIHSSVDNNLLIDYIDNKINSLNEMRSSLYDQNSLNKSIANMEKLNPLQKNTFLINILKYTLNDLKNIKKQTSKLAGLVDIDNDKIKDIANELFDETNNVVDMISTNQDDEYFSKYFLNETKNNVNNSNL